jgi:hypothetical protein
MLSKVYLIFSTPLPVGGAGGFFPKKASKNRPGKRV